MTTYVFLKFLGFLVIPPASLALGLGVAAVLAIVRFRRLARFAVALTLFYTLALSMSFVADQLMAPLQREARAEANAAAPCCYSAIVVMGGAIVPAQPPLYLEPNLTSSSDRIWQAARLYHRGVAPRIIVSGGIFVEAGAPAVSEASAMRQFLIDLGVPTQAIVEEGEALNTLQNVEFIRRLVGDKPLAVVTSAYHMPRTLRIARSAGLNVAGFPTDWHSGSDGPPWDRFLPSITAMSTSSLAMWEYMALAFDRRKVPAAQ